VASNLLRAAAGKESEQRAAGVEPERLVKGGQIGLRTEVVEQRMAHERDGHARGAEERLLEWKHDREMVHPSRHLPRTLWMPGPYLRSDVVEDPRAASLERRAEPKIEAWVVHQHHRVRAKPIAFGEEPPARGQEPRQALEDLRESEHRQRFARHQTLDADGPHLRPRDAADSTRSVRAQRFDQTGGVEIPGSLTRDDQEPPF